MNSIGNNFFCFVLSVYLGNTEAATGNDLELKEKVTFVWATV